MFGVAVPTGSGVLQSPVEPDLPRYVGRHIFMTIETQEGLRRLIKALVTFRAVLFPFGMAFDHLTGHQCRLNVVCPRHGRTPPPSHGEDQQDEPARRSMETHGRGLDQYMYTATTWNIVLAARM